MTDRRSPPSFARHLSRSYPDGLDLHGGSVLVAFLAATAVAAVHANVFPHLSVNHDEAVYLQQAAMLLEGELVMRPGPLAGAVRPWFFVQDGGRLYSKYTPVTAAVFAAAKLLTGAYAAALPAVAFAVVYLTSRVTAAAFDERTGLLAAAFVVGSPLFLVTTATFLSYAPTTALNLLFAAAYVRACRDGSLRWATVAGVAVGLAFFARPYTAVLFAAPFVGHALASTVGVRWADDRAGRCGVVRRNAVVATLGLAFVAMALAYNWRLTGDPLLFPYQAFAPQDGIGFGHRGILAHDADYTVAVALQANARVLWALATDWFAAPPLGTLLAVVGAGATAVRVHDRWPPSRPTGDLPDATLRLLLAGVALSVVAGNIAFWGNLNVLGNPEVGGDGLLSFLGPFYHFDLLVPLSAFAAHGALLGWDRLAGDVRSRVDNRHAAVALAAVLLVAPLATVGVAAVDAGLDRNAENTERLDRAYAPFEDRTFENALVFVPTTYGEWLNHPFQRLRNDPGLDGPAVYALDRAPSEDFAVLDRFPERRPYRYTYRGDWSADPSSRVTPKLVALAVLEGERLRVRTTVAVPEGASVSSVRLTGGGEATTYRPADAQGGRLVLTWVVTPGEARVVDGVASTGGSIPVDGPTALSLAVTLLQPGGSTLTYRQELSVAREEGSVRAVWPPETRVCRLTTDCGLEGTYVPGNPDEHVDGVAIEATVAVNGSVGGSSPSGPRYMNRSSTIPGPPP
jgi:hypothetical protein